MKRPTYCLVLFVSWAVGLDTHAQENLLPNPGFQQGDRGPAGWMFNHRGTDGEITWDRTRGRTGKASVRIASGFNWWSRRTRHVFWHRLRTANDTENCGLENPFPRFVHLVDLRDSVKHHNPHGPSLVVAGGRLARKQT